MGRLHLQFFPSPSRVYVCVVCGIQLTSMDHVRWVGLIGDQEPAKNYGKDGVINVQHGSQYCEHLSTGLFKLREVTCNNCHSYLGWRYEEAEKPNKDRQGTYMLLDRSLAGPFSD